jgi:hypothetical protein
MVGKNPHASRRKFLQQLGATSLAVAAGNLGSLAAEKKEELFLKWEKKSHPMTISTLVW